MPADSSTSPAEEAGFLVVVAAGVALSALLAPSLEAAERTVAAEFAKLRPRQQATAYIARVTAVLDSHQQLMPVR